jgi:hypothetical protein
MLLSVGLLLTSMVNIGVTTYNSPYSDLGNVYASPYNARSPSLEHRNVSNCGSLVHGQLNSPIEDIYMGGHSPHGGCIRGIHQQADFEVP